MARHGELTASEVWRLAAADGRRAWRRLLLTDLAYKVLAFALLTPLLGLAVRGGVAASGGPALADLDILFFLLRPVGLAMALVVAALALTLVALEQASLMAVAAGAAAGTRVGVARALLWAGAGARPILGVSIRLIARGILYAAPFLAGLGAIYLLLLREFDINYYLATRPPIFLLAVALAALLVFGLVWVLVPRIVGWVLALPLVLFEDAPPGLAMAESERRLALHRTAVRRVLVGWAAVATLLSLAAPALLFAIGRSLLPFGRGNVSLVLTLMLLLVGLWGVVNLLVTCFSAASFALLLVELFEQVGGDPSRSVAELTESGGARLRLSWRRGLVALAVVAVLMGCAGLLLLRAVRGDDDVLIIGHRGAAAAAPENTLAAVELAIEQGADFVEIDVQETADGEVVVVHDGDFMRVAGADLEVWETTWPELQRLDVGSWFGPQFASERPPRLRDVLERARGRAKVTIELKYYGHDEKLEQRVVELVDELGMADEVIVMSLEYELVQKVRALRPRWTVGLLTAQAIGDLTELDTDFLAVNVGIASRSFVRRAHAKGKQVYVWTVNDPVRMFQVMNLGVDGIITDEPALAHSLLDRRAGLATAERLLVGLAIFFGANAPDPPASADGG